MVDDRKLIRIMPKIVKYIPPTYELRNPPEPKNYTNVNDILEMDFIKRWSSLDDFYKFSVSRNNLIAEFKNGYEWHVIAAIEGIEDLDFPKWDKGRTKVTDGESEFTVEGVDVRSYCGEVVTMKDGRKLIRIY